MLQDKALATKRFEMRDE
jgi:hypothetical protein